jgi:hypothetical protein
MKTIDGKYYTHVGSKFKFILYLFDKGTYVNVQEKEESLLIKIYFSLSPNITSSVESNISILKETYELQATPYDQFEEGSVTDEDAIEINEPSLSDKEKLLKLLGDLYWLTDKVKIWDENNLAEGFKNLSDKHKKEIIKYVLHYPNDPDETGFYISEDEVNCLLKKLDENWESWDKSKKILSKNKIMNKNDDKFSNIKKIIGKVFGRYYMLYTAIIKWFDDTDFAELFAPSYLIANQLYNQEKEFITQFYDLFDQYLLNNENKGEENEEVKRFFTDIKRDIGSLLYHNLEKNAKIKKNSHELVIKIDGYDFLFTFLDGAISTLDKKWNLFYESNFIALRYLFFDDTINKVTINENELKINIIYDYDINETYILKKWYDGSSSVFSLKGELKELELENDYGNYYKFLQYLSLLNKTKSQKFVKPRQVAITCYYTKNESKYYNKTYLITIENYIDLVLKYFNKYLIHVEMRPEYVYNLFINEMSEYIKDVYFESIYEHIVEFLKRYSTLIEQEII